MVNKSLGIVILLLFIIVLPLSATMVSFLVIETGLRPDAYGGNYSTTWEDGLMGAFFDEGFIVSNSPVMRMQRFPEELFPHEADEAFFDAYMGGAEYFILVLLEFLPQGGTTRPQGALVRLFSTGENSDLIYEQRLSAGIGVGLRDEYIRAQDTGRILAARIKDR